MDAEAIPTDVHQLALDVGGVHVWLWDGAADRATWSPTWDRMLGYSPDELPTDLQGSLELVHPEDRTAIEHELEQLWKVGDDRSLLYRLRRRDGTWCWVRGSARAIDHEGSSRPGPRGDRRHRGAARGRGCRGTTAAR